MFASSKGNKSYLEKTSYKPVQSKLEPKKSFKVIRKNEEKNSTWRNKLLGRFIKEDEPEKKFKTVTLPIVSFDMEGDMPVDKKEIQCKNSFF